MAPAVMRPFSHRCFALQLQGISEGPLKETLRKMHTHLRAANLGR